MVISARIHWERSYRLIPSRFPPIDLFDDIADPADWELLAAAEAKSNANIYNKIGNLALVPVHRRVSGAGASWIMSAFTHISVRRTSRFSDGTYGVYYCGESLETAMMETAYHQGRFLAATNEPAGWVQQMRGLIAHVDNEFCDLRTGDFAELLDKNDYEAAQHFAKELRSDECNNGIVYPSVRRANGTCIAAFWPDVIALPKQGCHWQYHWDGVKIDRVRKLNMAESFSDVFELIYPDCK